jgi:hypothetical protein
MRADEEEVMTTQSTEKGRSDQGGFVTAYSQVLASAPPRFTPILGSEASST